MWRGYIKDQLNLEAVPKAFLKIKSFSIKEDLLASATSTFDCVEVADNISHGDVIIVADETGITKYLGVITSIEDTTINTSQMQSIYKGNWLYDLSDTSSVTSLEDIFAQALERYAYGKMKGSSYVDELVKQRLSSIQIKVSSQTQGAFLSQEDNYVCDMEEFIYSLYNSYQIQLSFNIPYEGKCSVTIGKSDLNEIKIGNNTNSIVDISPITEVGETNRLIIYSQDGTYRTTYVTKADGSVVKEPSGTANRFGVVKTSIVFSDDDDETLKQGHLPKTYNHKLTFTLRMLQNGLYKYKDFILGMPIAVWKDTEYFSTILTGKELSKEEEQPINEVSYTCGTVRTKLTEKLLMKYGVHNA